MDHLINSQVGRRQLLKMFGLGTGATTAAVLAADPVLAATLGYDEALVVRPETYSPPSGLARTTAAKDTALAWINGNERALTGLSDQIWRHAELSLREWNSSRPGRSPICSRPTDSGSSGGRPASRRRFVATYGSGGPVLGFSACLGGPDQGQMKT